MVSQDIDKFWQTFMEKSFASSGGGPATIYRGVTNKDHKLIPSIARHPAEHTVGGVTDLERDLLEEFKRLSIRELEFVPDNEFEWVFLAQHHGLPTRLLDWSTNPLVALYFSVERGDERDGAVYTVNQAVTDQYILFDYRTADYTEEHRKNPASIIAIQQRQREVIFVRPKYKDRRYHNQASVFSCPAQPFEPLVPTDQLIVPKELKPLLRERLKKLGVSASFIYPGLDGVASEVKILLYNPVESGRVRRVSVSGALQL
ncbi:FRG domain-containing protein [Burkholderia orbicola]|uniref:FRG domain-containing protein n=1 Tax=Burkholderia orbicola TaxID=2978683 RepID=UPI001907D534|nr:FRG domain-containing protein [Burkholderia orbicola]MBK1822190.1 FRG domain-containing protein [Burkholderia orbicola]